MVTQWGTGPQGSYTLRGPQIVTCTIATTLRGPEGPLSTSPLQDFGPWLVLNAYLLSISSYSHDPFRKAEGPSICLSCSLMDFPDKTQGQDTVGMQLIITNQTGEWRKGRTGALKEDSDVQRELSAKTEAGIQVCGRSQPGPLLMAPFSWPTPVPSAPGLLFPPRLALMGAEWSPRCSYLHHRMTWFQVKSVASSGLTTSYTTQLVMREPSSFSRLSFCWRKPALSPL